MASFESWLLHRVAHAVEAGEVPADLLADLRTEIEGARALSQAQGHALAVQGIATRVGLPVPQVETTLAALEAQPAGTRGLLLRQFVEAWLVQQREEYGQGEPEA